MTSRTAILELAKTLPPGHAVADARAALARDDFDAAATVLLAGAHRGELPDAATAAQALRGMDDPVLACALLGRLGPQAVEAVCLALEPGPLTPTQEAHLLFCAAHALGGARASPRLLALLRPRARARLHEEEAPLVLAAIAAAGDAETAALRPGLEKTLAAKEARGLVEETKGWMTRPLEQVLPEEPLLGPPLPGARKPEKVPRNAPCPCGSGKKYKVCHGANEGAAAAPAGGLDAQLKAASPELQPKHVDALRLAELLRLDFQAMGTSSLGVAYDRLCALARLEVAERALEVLVQRQDLGRVRPDDYRLDLVLYALEQGDAALADRQRAKLADPTRWDALHTLERDWLGGELPVSRVEALARAALEKPDELPARELAWVLLRRAPALGVLVARGVLPTAGKTDGRELLYSAQDARDRLALPSAEPGWAVYEALFPASGDSARDAQEEHAALDRRARALAKQLEDSQKRLTDVEGRLHALAGGGGPAPTGEGGDKEKLQQKVSELKELLKEGNQERAELRRSLQHVTEQLATQSEPAPTAAAEPEDSAEEGDGLDAPRGVLAPAFARAAQDALERLPRNIARDAVLKVSEVAAGVASAWREVKRMQHVPGYLSVRVGIHHRVLFHLDVAQLVVDEVIHRQDLDATVRRLGR